MKQVYATMVALIFLAAANSCQNRNETYRNPHLGPAKGGEVIVKEGEHEEEAEEYDEPNQAMWQEFEQTRDPKTNRVPRETLWPIIEYTDQLKQDLRGSIMAAAKGTSVAWTERGPNTDTADVNNGNTRNGNGSTSGRIRAVMVDVSDTTGNTVFVGGVDGGIWKTTNINNSSPNWILINDKLSNLAVTSICQDTANPSTMYFCTGEPNYNADAVQGDGVFKSTNGGSTWTQLSSTTGTDFDYCSKIVCDGAGNVYVGTLQGLFRSTNGGSSWTNITPTGINVEVADIQIGSSGRMHLVTGLFTSGTNTVDYRYANSPSTASSSSGWSTATSPFSNSNKIRAILACVGDTLLAVPANSSGYGVTYVYRSYDGGDHWAALSSTPSLGSQGWYCLAAAINPDASTHQYFLGSLDGYRSTNAGSSWTKVAEWIGSSGPSYVHADHQNALWYHTSTQSRIIIVCDGGIFLSTDGGLTFSSRNNGLRIKQFYSVALDPQSGKNHFLGGTQDNGCHILASAGLGPSTEVVGGDGAYCHIDQNQPQYQFASYVRNQYWVSSDSGKNWTQRNFSTAGLFINPTDYDNTLNKMYCTYSYQQMLRWNNPQSAGNSNTILTINGMPFNHYPTAFAVSPYTSDRVMVGTNNGGLFRCDTASTKSSPLGKYISSGLGYIHSIVYGGSEDTIMVTRTSYTGTQVWYTTNGSATSPTWSAKDGNLPNMPVWWSLLVPGTYGKTAIVATETGVWVTGNLTASSPTWVPDPSFPNVRTDMMKYRPSDKIVVAATHGRGMWSALATSAVGIPLPVNNFKLTATPTGNEVNLNWTFSTARDVIHFELQRSENASDYTTIYTTDGGAAKNSYSTTDPRSVDGWRYYRVKSTDAYGLVQYSNIVSVPPGGNGDVAISQIYPNPMAGNTAYFSTVLTNAADVQIRIYDAMARLVWSQNSKAPVGKNVTPLQIGALRPGNYLVLITAGSHKSTQVVVKQ